MKYKIKLKSLAQMHIAINKLKKEGYHLYNTITVFDSEFVARENFCLYFYDGADHNIYGNTNGDLESATDVTWKYIDCEPDENGNLGW